MVEKARHKIESDKGYLLELPLTAKDISFNAYCDFMEADEAFLNKFEEERDGKMKTIEPLQHMFSCCEPIVLECNEGFNISVLSEADLFYIYTYFLDLIKDYKTDIDDIETEYAVTIDNVEYVITEQQFEYLRSESLTVGETIEFMEIERFVKHKLEKIKELSNFEFNLGLSQVAILLRQRGEILPVSKSKRDNFIEKRKLIFQHLPLSTVLDIRGFFLRILKESSQMYVTDTFLKNSKNTISGAA